ncbi:MAG: ATP-binding protein [Trueperaceae bacterium]
MSACYIFRRLESQRWWRALGELELALEEGGSVSRSYSNLVSALIDEGYDSLPQAAAAALCEGEEVLARGAGELPAGLCRAALLDLASIRSRVDSDWQGRSAATTGTALAPLTALAHRSERTSELEAWGRRLLSEEPEPLLDALRARYRACGTGLLARYSAFHWRSGGLNGVETAARDRLEELVGLERQLERLTQNVERFLAGAPALHTLLYGPRGSGKSTAVRALLNRYAGRGLRLVEVPLESLAELPELSERLRGAPHRYLVFVDDLSFESGDAAYHPLKTLLEGSVAERPENVLLIATSNRRHLVREGFSDRPMPEDDDVHAWDTTNERLALADRFGLAITFPSANQRHYLIMVRELARQRNLNIAGGELDSSAIRFADWGNGYSGRTARQFIDTLVVPAPG